VVSQGYVIQQDLTNEDLERLRAAGLVAIDTETTGLQPRRDFLALVQICDPNGVVNVLRRRDWMNAHNLLAFLGDDSIEKVCHYAPFEAVFFLSHLRVAVQNFYCTRITSKLVRTYTNNHDYDYMVYELLGIKIEEESVGLSDWYTTKELTSAQLPML
jgi:Ribonuclease D